MTFLRQYLRAILIFCNYFLLLSNEGYLNFK